MNTLILTAFKNAIPYVIAMFVGFSGAWYIQGLRITSLKQEAVAKEQAIKEANQKERDRIAKINEETNDAWHKNLDALHDCYKSGRCGVPARYRMPGPGISAAAQGVGLRPADDGLSAAGTAALAQDCAVTTLQLLDLIVWVQQVGETK